MTPYEWSLRAGMINDAGNAGINPSFIIGKQPTAYHELLIAKDADFLQALSAAYNSTTNVDYFKTAGVFATPNVPGNTPGTAAPSVAPPAGSTAGDNAHKDSSYGLGV